MIKKLKNLTIIFELNSNYIHLLRLKRSILTAIITLFFSVNSWANYSPENENFMQDLAQKDHRAFNPLRPTPSRLFKAELSRPDVFFNTNNLAKKTGSFFRSFGEIIFLKGKVTDSFGVPISDVVIKIWQANSAGKYHNLLNKNSEYIDPHFNMSGKVLSDNLGDYSFITILPGGVKGRAPHINMNVYHPKFGKLETELYFENHHLNNSDYQYLSYSEQDRKSLTAKVRNSNFLDNRSIKIVTFDIILKGIQQYKGFN